MQEIAKLKLLLSDACDLAENCWNAPGRAVDHYPDWTVPGQIAALRLQAKLTPEEQEALGISKNENS